MKKQTQGTYQIPEIKYPSSFPSSGTQQPIHTITPSQLAGNSVPLGPVAQMLVITEEEVECSDDDVTIMLNSVIQNCGEESQILKGVVQNTRKAQAKKNTGEASNDQREPEEQASTKGKKKTPIPTAGQAQTSSTPVAAAEPKDKAPAAEAIAKLKDTH